MTPISTRPAADSALLSMLVTLATAAARNAAGDADVVLAEPFRSAVVSLRGAAADPSSSAIGVTLVTLSDPSELAQLAEDLGSLLACAGGAPVQRALGTLTKLSRSLSEIGPSGL